MQKFWNIKNENDTEAELMLYGEISDHSWYGDEITPKLFADDLKKCKGKALTVAINSGGGDVFAAQAIYTQLKYYPGNITVRIDGLCASAATIIACAGDTVIMPSNAIYMIHNPSVIVADYLVAEDARKIAGQLDTVKDTIVAVYEAKSRGALNAKKICKLMDAETWMDAETAKNYGFIDEISPNLTVANSLSGGILTCNGVSCYTSKFKNAAKIEEIFNKFNQEKAQNVPILAKKQQKKEGIILNEKSVIDKLKDIIDKLGKNPAPDVPEAPEKPTDAVIVERERIAALDALNDGRKNVTAIIETAKKNGQTVEEVKPFVDAMPAEKEETATLDAIKALIADNMKSGAERVKALPTDDKTVDEATQKQRDIEEIANIANKMRGLD